jgi:hypothetical protein
LAISLFIVCVPEDLGYTACSPLKIIRRLGGTWLCLPPAFTIAFCLAYSSTLIMDATCSSVTLVVCKRTTCCYIPEDRTLHNHCCGNLKSYISLYLFLYPFEHIYVYIALYVHIYPRVPVDMSVLLSLHLSTNRCIFLSAYDLSTFLHVVCVSFWLCVLWHVDQLLGNDREIKNVQQPLLSNGFANRYVPTSIVELQQRRTCFLCGPWRDVIRGTIWELQLVSEWSGVSYWLLGFSCC